MGIKSKLLNEYLSEIWANFDESTLISPNKNGGKEKIAIDESKHEIKKENIAEFINSNSVSINEFFLGILVLTLNKFNFSSDALIFNENNVPFAAKFENREIYIKDFLEKIHKDYNKTLEFENYVSDDKLFLKPKFYYNFNETSKARQLDYSNFLNILENDETVLLSLYYDNNLYTKDFMDLFLSSFEKITNQIINGDISKTRLCDIAIETESENIVFNEVDIPFVHKRFERQVEKTPYNTALVASDAELTYEELNQKANRIANALIKKGLKPKSNILVMLPRDSNFISAILGILKAGCAFIAVDIEYPKARIDYIFENSDVDYLISLANIDKSTDIEELLLEENTANPNVDISPDDLAYMIYTSGSTGNPKGVMISHRNITNLFSKNQSNMIYNSYSKMNKILAISTVSFDAFLLDFMGLTFGVELVLANDNEIKNIKALTDLVKRQKPDTLAIIVPSRLRQYLEYPEFSKELSSFSYIGLGGEMLSRDLVEELLKYPDLNIFNLYGPTETTVTCNANKITSADNITVGKSLYNYITEVRDIDGKLLPQGVIGELYIGGVGVSRGYYNMEKKTEDVFLTMDGIRYYKSGDYAVKQQNGEISIKGRIDNQIKLRGLRIEIGEIENNIAQYPNIKQVTVVIKKINNNEHLCAYFTAENEVEADDLKEYLTQHLPHYMVPTVFMQLDEMPMSLNGKTDINQLPEPELNLNYVAPENELEQLICSIFSSVIGIESVGAEDSFFEIGGTSLIASKLILELIKRDYIVKYEDIFNNQTPRQLAKFLSDNHDIKEINNDNYDYTSIDNLLSENTFENFSKGEKQEIGNLLLTGVTGYLGIHVLYEYIKNEEGTVYCMLRKGEFESCRDRLVNLMDYYFDEDLSDLIGSRIILSEGDITNFDGFKKLKNYSIDTVINCAAIVKHYTADDYIFKVNVDGVINGIKFAQSIGARFVQISTLSVILPYMDEKFASGIKLDEKTLYYGQDLSNKYINSKFLAERNVLEAAINGLDVKVIRVGNLMGRYSDGLFQKNYNTNAFLANIKSIKNLQNVSNFIYDAKMEISPIDCTAKAIITLAKTPKECRVFNCQNNNLIHIEDIVNALNSFGYDIKQVDDEKFIETCRKNLDENIQGLITSNMAIKDSDTSSFAYWDNLGINQTIDILHSYGFDWPEIDENYLKRFISYLNTLEFFN